LFCSFYREVKALFLRTKIYNMKHRLFIALITFLMLACKSEVSKGPNGVVYKSAVQYNDYIVGRQTSLMKDILAFVDVAQSDLDSAYGMLDRFVKQTGTMITEIKGMPAYKGDSALRDAAVNSFGFYRKLFEKEYRDILHLRSEQDGLSTDIEDRIEAIVKRIEEEEKGYDDRFQEAQKAFASKNKMKLVDNEMQKEFDNKTDPGK
jgi:hypothetical protein